MAGTRQVRGQRQRSCDDPPPEAAQPANDFETEERNDQHADRVPVILTGLRLAEQQVQRTGNPAIQRPELKVISPPSSQNPCM